MINLFIRRNLFSHIGRSTQSVVKPAVVFAATVCQGNKVINKITGVTLEDDEPRAVNVHEVQKCNVVAIVATSDGKFPETFPSGKFPETFRKVSGNFPEWKLSQEFPRNFPSL